MDDEPLVIELAQFPPGPGLSDCSGLPLLDPCRRIKPHSKVKAQRHPGDKTGVPSFPCLPVRDALESAPDERLARGFSIGVYNKRGVTSRSMTEGGQQEYDLTDKYAAWAAAVQASHPRTAAALRDIAESYREEGRRNDEEARRFLEGMDF